MKEQFNASQISKVIDQALIYQCACPAQVCKAIFELRELYDYQMNCANDTVNDVNVHRTIAMATEKSHEIMEDCLRSILQIEGWDTTTFELPESMKKKSVKPI
ncbi:MAG: hypothetical protein V4757_03875 [Pseudomonadota bacterium]